MTAYPNQETVDLSHHINSHSKGRHPSPLKDLIKYMNFEGMISLAGGLPHPSFFPFQNLSIGASQPSNLSQSAETEQDLLKISTAILPAPNSVSDLGTALQYGTATGNSVLVSWIREFTKTVMQPVRSDFEVLINNGNTDAWCKVVRLLCEPGDYILCEEYTFPTAMAAWTPLGCRGVPIKMDGLGLRADDLEEVLGEWDTVYPGVKRPHLLNIVPVGSNPSGTTMDGQRRKEIYEICVKYDIIICEDDPYYFLQYPVYNIEKSSTTTASTKSTDVFSPQKFLDSLVPTFLKYDYQGRVIRLETFSKTLGPGNRLGYFVANPLFTERLLRATEVETSTASGWSQMIVLELLNKWGTNGFIEWLANLRDQYTIRRDWMCDSISSAFNTIPSPSLPGSILASSKALSTPVFSFVPPTGGMFLWLRLDFSKTSRFLELSSSSPKSEDPEKTYMDELWLDLCEHKLLLSPGSYFVPWQGKEKATTKTRGVERGVGYFRVAFSMATKDEMDVSMQRVVEVFDKWWKV